MKLLHRRLMEKKQGTGRRLTKMLPRYKRPKYQVRANEPFIPSLKSNEGAGQENTQRKRPASDGFVYPAQHLKKFNLLERETRLYGNLYKLIIKSVWYASVGQVIKDNIIQLGDVRTDCRNNFAYALPSGWGKKHIEVILKKVCKKLGDKFSTPTSLHPEQLVGRTNKIEKTGRVTYRQEKGYFGDDLVLFNDAIELVRGDSPRSKESQKYLCTALDLIGENLVTKRMTGIPREYGLRFYPHCTIILVFQPFSLAEEVFLGGLFRRLPTIYLPLSERDQEEFSRKTAGHENEDQPKPSFAGYLKHLKNENPNPPSIKDEKVKKRFDELHLMLLDYGRSFGNKSANFTYMIDFCLQEWLLKMATVLAYSRRKQEMEVFDVEMAFVDLLEFWHSTLTFIEKKVLGSLDYGETWQGATGKDQEILSWLWEEGAVSEDSSKISIQDYTNKISEVFGKTPDSSRNIYRRHRKMGWVTGKQISSHDSLVYLNFKPSLRGMGGEGGRVVRKYVEILEKHFLYPNFSLKPSISTFISTSDTDKLVDQGEKLTPQPIFEEQKHPSFDTTQPSLPPTGDTTPLAIEEDVINPFSSIKVD